MSLLSYMKRLLSAIIVCITAVSMYAQDRIPQNKPYIDLRPLHFGILVGFQTQDLELQNVGPQPVLDESGNKTGEMQTIVCEDDKWDPGISVGVLAEARLSNHFTLRFTPTMHFGGKHLTFTNLSKKNEDGTFHQEYQSLKTSYVSLPIDIKFAAQRFNNYRPYIMAGINPMINLTGKDQDFIKLKKYDTMLEVGLGCDFYLPFFKLIPELKFCYGLTNSYDQNHANEIQDKTMRPYTTSVNKAASKMIVLTFYFE